MMETKRDSSVVLYRLHENAYFLVISLAHRNDVQLVRFECLSGALQYSNVQKLDVFESEEEVVDYLGQQGDLQVEGHGVAVLGYVVVGNMGLLLLVEKARDSAILPGNVKIKTVASARWHKIPCRADLGIDLQSDASPNYEMLENRISKITEFPIHGAHWYCEDADVTRPFPSQNALSDPSWQFTWNAWLSESFRMVGLDFVCPALMEGTAESRDLEDGFGDSFTLVLLSRRTRLNPGTRYIARGLNDLCEPGNEIECEQIVWRPTNDPRGDVQWNRFSWRRGTVPIRWGVVLKNGGIGEAEIVIRKQNTFEGSKKSMSLSEREFTVFLRYIRRLQKRFSPIPEIEDKLHSDEEATIVDSQRFPIVFVSLLRKGLPDKNRSETNLAAAFDKALSMVRKTHNLNVAYYALDWHEMDKQLGTQGLIEALWIAMKGVLQSHDLSSGYYSKTPTSEEGPKTHWYGSNTIHWQSQQQGIVRYNCADSLDRTNIASFFVCIQVFVEQCRRLDLDVLTGDPPSPKETKPKTTFKDRIFGGLMKGTASTSTRPKESSARRNLKSPRVQFRSKLPVGWEAKVDAVTGYTYYVDHVNKRTSWTLPETHEASESERESLQSKLSLKTRRKAEVQSRKPWSMLETEVDDFKSRVLPEALSSMADIFLQNGDRNAFFYTGSQAMHSDKIMIFEPESSHLKKNSVGGASNSFIAITRRYNNVVKDSDRQAQIELFLGINLEKYFLPPSSVEMDLDSLNILYKLGDLPQDTEDTDEDDPVDSMDYFSLSAKVIQSQTKLEPARSLSSPSLMRPEDDATSHIVEREQIQMYSFEEELRNLKPRSTSPSRTEGAASPELVSGLRELSVSSNPLN